MVQGTSKVIYDDSSSEIVSEIVMLEEVEWLPCYKCSPRFVSLSKQLKPRWKSELKTATSSEHSTKAYTDDVTLISISKEVHTKALIELDYSKAGNVGLKLKPSKCVSLLFNGTKFCSNRITLSGGTTKTILYWADQIFGQADWSFCSRYQSYLRANLCLISSLTLYRKLTVCR